MSSGLVRYQHTGDLHFITFSCFRHRPILGTPEARDLFLTLLERTRELYDFHILGYVVMPDHVHLLVSEPAKVPLSQAIQILKQRFSKTRPESEVWESRYYDFNVKTEDKRAEKLQYIHQNPVRRGLVTNPADYPWSSFNSLNDPTASPVHLTLPRF
jgi:putative transposase